MIELINFTKSYELNSKQKKEAVSDVSFVVPQNSITGLLGPNGAGKTTIIKAICSIHYATNGNIFIYDKNNNKFDAAIDIEDSKKLIGYVSENPILYKNFTVIEYLKMIADIWNICDTNLGKSLNKVITDFKLKDVLWQKISTLSKGFTQRVNFASALIHNPEILILDEPSSGLDPNQIIETRNLIKSFSKDKTILLSTHIMQEAENLCDNIVIISEGKVLKTGSIEDVKNETNSKNLEQAYINLTKGKSKNDK